MKPKSSEHVAEMEQLIMCEGIVSATGLSSESVQVGIKGDPSIRDSVFNRKKHTSTLDVEYAKLQRYFEELMLKPRT